MAAPTAPPPTGEEGGARERAPVPAPRQQQFRDLLQRALPAVQALVPKHMTGERLILIAQMAASRNPLLYEATPLSIVAGIVQAAQLGLEIGSALHHASLVPYRNNKTGKYEAVFMVEYRGLVELARRSGEIVDVEARAVHAHDEFDYAYGLQPVLLHKPCRDGEPGPLTFTYAIAHFRDGRAKFDVMRLAEIEALRRRSRAADSGPWVTDFEEMSKKCPVRRLMKLCPQSPELAAALEAENEAEAGERPAYLERLAGAAEEPALKGRGESLREKMREKAAAATSAAAAVLEVETASPAPPATAPPGPSPSADPGPPPGTPVAATADELRRLLEALAPGSPDGQGDLLYTISHITAKSGKVYVGVTSVETLLLAGPPSRVEYVLSELRKRVAEREGRGS